MLGGKMAASGGVLLAGPDMRRLGCGMRPLIGKRFNRDAPHYARVERTAETMKLLDALVEQRIAEAAARGDVDDASTGPMGAESQRSGNEVPVLEEIRVANRILMNAGFVPPAAAQLRALCELEPTLTALAPAVEALAVDPTGQCRMRAKWLAVVMALESLRGDSMAVPAEYCRRVAERLTGGSGDCKVLSDAPVALDSNSATSSATLHSAVTRGVPPSSAVPLGTSSAAKESLSWI
jgi:hypothetical protein